MRPFINTVTRKAVLAAAFVFALAASVSAAPQHGGGHGGGGGHFVGGGPRGHVGGAHSNFHGSHGHFHGSHGHFVVRGGFVSPFWGSYYPYWGYPYWDYPYGYGYPSGAYYSVTPRGDVKTKITPKQTEVYVDGYIRRCCRRLRRNVPRVAHVSRGPRRSSRCASTAIGPSPRTSTCDRARPTN